MLSKLNSKIMNKIQKYENLLIIRNELIVIATHLENSQGLSIFLYLKDKALTKLFNKQGKQSH